MGIVYTPPPTVAEFLRSNSFGNFIVGPVGSGKTTGMLFRIAKMAKEQRPGPNGKRKFRAIIVRNTAQQLMDTSLRSWLTWFPEGEAGVYERVNKIFHLRFDDVEAEVWFRPLDTPDDVRRLLSVEANVICFDEFREISPDVYNAATGRVGRYPSKKDGGPFKDDGTPNFGVFGATNPPDADTFWEELLSKPADNVKVFFQPSGLSPEAENLDNLPGDYYDNLCAGKTEDWISVYVEGKFGKSLAGQPVFRSFSLDRHVAKTELRPIRSEDRPLIIGMDFGLNPSCTISQLDLKGRLLTYACLTADGMGVLRFTQTMLKPLLASKFPGFKTIIIGDPAGTQRAQTDERSVFDILRQEKFKVIPARSNSIVARVAAVDKFLMRSIDGEPGHLIDPSCKPLINALRGGYRYKLKKNGEVEDAPEKNAASHIADAHQYACLHADTSATGVALEAVKREIKKVPAYGWT
jgi:hypothetical protein